MYILFVHIVHLIDELAIYLMLIHVIQLEIRAFEVITEYLTNAAVPIVRKLNLLIYID